MTGKVFLIGAGPGDPGLLTLRGAELLGQCDVVLYDGLSNQALLAHAPQAEPICVGKHGQSRIWKQSEIIKEMLDHARAGRNVVRLKGGDPAVFARTAEEVEALLEAKIPYEIVPGITAALAAGSYAGIPVTHRKLASAVALVTGHEEPGKSESALDWQALARFPGTLVIYMGVTTAPSWTSALIDSGKDPTTPTALVRRCSHDDQQTVLCTLGDVARHLTPASRFRPPVIAIIGPVAELSKTWDWISSRPLHGQTVLVTRAVDQSDALARPLRELGARVIIQPAISIGPPNDMGALDQAIEQLPETDVVIFCSVNGTKYFIDRLLERHGDVRRFGGMQIAAVGEKTAGSLQPYCLRADIIPPDFRASSLVETLEPIAVGKRITIVRASRGSDELSTRLRDAGASVREVVAYQNEDVKQVDENVLSMMRSREIDWVTVTSSATASNLARLFGDALSHVKVASLSPVTSRTLADLDLSVAVEANPYTLESLIQAIVDHVTNDQENENNR